MLIHREAIAATITAYLAWVRTGERDLWRRAFHAQASVVNASRGNESVAVWPIEEFVRRVEVLRRKVGVVEETARALPIDVARHVAVARMECSLRLGSEP